MCNGSDNIGHCQVRGILSIESHDMVLAFTYVLVRKLGVSIDLLLARESRLLNHLEDVYAFVGGLR